MMKSCALLFAMSLLTLAATMPTDLSFADDVESKQEPIAANMSCAEQENTINNYNLEAMTKDQFLDLTELITNFMLNCFFNENIENSQNGTKSSGHVDLLTVHEGVVNALKVASRWGIYFQLESMAAQYKEIFIEGFLCENDDPNETSQPPSFGKFMTEMMKELMG